MNRDDATNDDSAAVAVDQLSALGLSTYAARTFVALSQLGTGTAKEVSEVSTVPRTRVYDAVDELRDEGLVEVQQSTPKRFWPISVDTTARRFRRTTTQQISTLTDALEELGGVETREEQQGVWTVRGEEAVTDRLREFFASADDEIVFMTVEELLADELLDELARAAQRGVSIHLGGVSEDVQRQIQAEIPNAELFESLWVWSDTPAGRIAMIDDRATLASVLVREPSDGQSVSRGETAIWGSGRTNSLVVVLKAVFTWKLETADGRSGD